ncbi:MAG: GNAT family N-acetyltransferase [Acidimicrobiales bacterium]
MEGARPATSADLAAIEAVAQRVRHDLDGGRGADLFFAREAGPWPARDRWCDRLEADDGVVLVGTYSGAILGYAVAVVEPLLDGRLLGVIEDLAVDPEARGVGIGEAMMDGLLVELRRLGCIGVDARALPGDRQTKNFFESFGLKARLLTVHRALIDDEPGDG